MGRDSLEAGDCPRCGGYGFTVHWRSGRRHPYPCPTCGTDRRLTALEARRVLAEHGDELRTTYAL